MNRYTIGELGYSRGDLVETVSHYHWGNFLGIGEDGLFRLRMFDGEKLLFDPVNGSRIQIGD